MSAHIRAGAVSGTEYRRRSKGRDRRSEQRERGPFRALKMRPVRQGLSTVCGVGCSAVRAFDEDASRTVGGCFRYRISLPYRRSLFFTPNASENAPRTPGACFAHRAHILYRRRGFLVRRASENASHLVVRNTGKRVAVASERPCLPPDGAEESCRRSGAWRTF